MHIDPGACSRIGDLLRKAHFGQIPPCFFLLNRATIVKHFPVLNPFEAYAKIFSRKIFCLKSVKNLTKNGLPSLRFPFSARLLVA